MKFLIVLLIALTSSVIFFACAVVMVLKCVGVFPVSTWSLLHIGLAFIGSGILGSIFTTILDRIEEENRLLAADEGTYAHTKYFIKQLLKGL